MLILSLLASLLFMFSSIKNDRPQRTAVFDALVLLYKAIVTYFALVGKVNILFPVADEL